MHSKDMGGITAIVLSLETEPFCMLLGWSQVHPVRMVASDALDFWVIYIIHGA